MKTKQLKIKPKSDKVAVVIVNYNMPEKTDALYEYLEKNSTYPHDIYIVDNGSDLAEKSQYTDVFIKKNIQTTGGWLRGLEEADKEPYEYFAYMFLITSTNFEEESKDPITSMVKKLKDDIKAVAIHASLTQQSILWWKHLINRNGKGYRRTWFIDNICSMYRSDWFDKNGRFDKELIYAHGIDLEMCYKARMQKYSIWIDDNIQVTKITDIGYKMNRMQMSAEERRKKARANMVKVLEKKYGSNWEKKMLGDSVMVEWL